MVNNNEQKTILQKERKKICRIYVYKEKKYENEERIKIDRVYKREIALFNSYSLEFKYIVGNEQ